MSTSDTIFLNPGIPLDQAVDHLCTVLPWHSTRDADGSTFLVRDLSSGPVREVGGLIGPNIFRAEVSALEEMSVLDGYALTWDIRTVPKSDDDVLHAVTLDLFTDLVRAVPDWPALLTLQVDLLLAASAPGAGLVRFPAGTTPDEPDRELWRPFDLMPGRR